MTLNATHSLIECWWELFDGNRMAIGTEEGGCERMAVAEDWVMWTEGHLRGVNPPVGVYPMVLRHKGVAKPAHTEWHPEWRVKWGCVDFDEGDKESWVHAKNTYLALTTFGITGWIERSRSKGYHVWVFSDEWVDAPIMRYALLAACQLVDAPTKEINPKQTHLLPDQLGNYVRLPYPGGLQQPRPARRVVVPADGVVAYSLSEFVGRAYKSRTSTEPLRTLAERYVEPERPMVRRDWSTHPSEMRGDAIDRLMGKALVIFEQGPLEGSGRGHTLYKLACYLKEDGRHTVEEAVELVRDADSRWGKFYARPDGDKRIMELIEKAWFSPR